MMGTIEDAVDAAANFIGPFVDKSHGEDSSQWSDSNTTLLVEQALVQLQIINKADLASDPGAPYDASLAGVVYGLLDLITTLGVLPNLSTGIAFSQRPKSVLASTPPASSQTNHVLLDSVMQVLLPILAQQSTGVQPLVSQRILPDIISAVTQLALCPESSQDTQSRYLGLYSDLMKGIPTSRLLPILTTFLHQALPSWWKPTLAYELATLPLRPQGIRHTIEFLSLSYLSKDAQISQDASGLETQIPIPLEAVTQAARLLVLPPTGTSQDDWLRQLAPQLWSLLDGENGKELSRAAGQIIAGGILSKKATGAPGTIGWELFIVPLLQSIYPKDNVPSGMKSGGGIVIVEEIHLLQALRRLAVIVKSYSHTGLIKRLIVPLLLPLWSLLAYVTPRPAINKEWSELPEAILARYFSISCDARQVDSIATNMFWDGTSTWCFAPGAKGGVEIRGRTEEQCEASKINNIFQRVESIDSTIKRLISLLVEANIADEIIGSIFLQTTKRWLSTDQSTKDTLLDNSDDPTSALVTAKLSEAMANKFRENFVRSPQHILELMSQLLQNFVTAHQNNVKKQTQSRRFDRADLHNIIPKPGSITSTEDNYDEEIASFAISILSTLVSSPDFKHTPSTRTVLASSIPSLVYLSQPHPKLPITPLLTNASTSLLHILQPSPSPSQLSTLDPLIKHRETLTTALSELTSPDPPNRTWALHQVQSLVNDPTAFPVIDIPSLTHLLLSAALADPESYVHTAAIPLVVDLASKAGKTVIKILLDAFVDIGETSLKNRKARDTAEEARALEEALDTRLRVGEVLSRLVGENEFWNNTRITQAAKRKVIERIVEMCLSLASRRGQRTNTLSTRIAIATEEKRIQSEAETAWNGPIPNLLDPDDEDNAHDRRDRDALLRIVQGWENTGVEEDVRIRVSGLSILSIVFEHRLGMLSQSIIDAALQSVFLVLTMEGGDEKAILRRAAVLIVLGILKGLGAALERETDVGVSLGIKAQEEVKRVLEWIGSEDGDEMVRDHAGTVLEGLETLSMKKVYKIRGEGLKMGPDLGLGQLRGLDISPIVDDGKQEKRRLVIEEIE